MPSYPIRFRELIWFHDVDTSLGTLAALAESEDWNYQNSSSSYKNPILYNYVKYTYTRLVSENKIHESSDTQALVFNTGLVTPHQEEIFCYCTPNRVPGQQPWYFDRWVRKGEYDLSRFSMLPEMAHYYSDPSTLIYDHRKEVRVNINHIISENIDRFPVEYQSNSYALTALLKGALDNAKERARRNYKTGSSDESVGEKWCFVTFLA